MVIVRRANNVLGITRQIAEGSNPPKDPVDGTYPIRHGQTVTSLIHDVAMIDRRVETRGAVKAPARARAKAKDGSLADFG